jgi:hypothetical protein
MHIRKRYLLFSFLLLVVILFFFSRKSCVDTTETRNFNLSLQQLRGVSKLVIWEQDFTLNDLETKEKTYLKWFKAKESVVTTVNGRMGFHIDLSDSIHTHISDNKDSITVKAPLRVTYVSLDLASLQQVKEASINPAVNIDKQEIIRHLDQKALEKYLPAISEALRSRSLESQEKQLERLIGKKVHIVITGMPAAAPVN